MSEKPNKSLDVTLICSRPGCGQEFTRRRHKIESSTRYGAKKFYCSQSCNRMVQKKAWEMF